MPRQRFQTSRVLSGAEPIGAQGLRGALTPPQPEPLPEGGSEQGDASPRVQRDSVASHAARPMQVDLPHKTIQEASNRKFQDALSLIHSAWQRSDSLCRGRASRDPWC